MDIPVRLPIRNRVARLVDGGSTWSAEVAEQWIVDDIVARSGGAFTPEQVRGELALLGGYPGCAAWHRKNHPPTPPRKLVETRVPDLALRGATPAGLRGPAAVAYRLGARVSCWPGGTTSAVWTKPEDARRARACSIGAAASGRRVMFQLKGGVSVLTILKEAQS